MSKICNVAVVGASGLVGRTILNVLAERNFPVNELKLLASAKSAGKEMIFKNKTYQIQELTKDSFKGIDIALFSAGATVSKEFVPAAVDAGCIVIDNGSYWRLNKDVPLVVPEVNANVLANHNGLIANPNCSTIQFVVPLFAINQVYKIKRVIASTYQAISGAGQKGLDKFHNEMQGIPNNDKYSIFNNIMFHSPVNAAGMTIEEEKMLNETRKILNIPTFKLAVTCVRIPVKNSHCIAVNIEFEDSFDINEIEKILSNTKGIVYIPSIGDDYPTPQMSNGRDEVFVGRLRRDESVANGINLWIVADNLRKGAATNAVQIAEYILQNDLYSIG